MASVYSTIANGGVRVQPTLVQGATSSSGKYQAAAASPTRRVIQPSTAKNLIAAMQRSPATEYLVIEHSGEVYGVLATSDVEARVTGRGPATS